MKNPIYFVYKKYVIKKYYQLQLIMLLIYLDNATNKKEVVAFVLESTNN